MDVYTHCLESSPHAKDAWIWGREHWEVLVKGWIQNPLIPSLQLSWVGFRCVRLPVTQGPQHYQLGACAKVLEPVRTFRIQTQPREGWFRLKRCLWKCVFTLFENCSRKWESRTKEATIKLRDLRALFFNIQLCFKNSFCVCVCVCSKFHLWFHAKTSYLALGAEQ